MEKIVLGMIHLHEKQPKKNNSQIMIKIEKSYKNVEKSNIASKT